jgi:hypothetical protein
MNKQALVRKIVTQLVEELERNRRAAQTAHAEATHEQSKAENKYDTRGLEASYLAHGQARQMMEMETAILAFENMDLRRFGAGDPICTGALVELEHDGERTFYFIGSKAGGMKSKWYWSLRRSPRWGLNYRAKSRGISCNSPSAERKINTA